MMKAKTLYSALLCAGLCTVAYAAEQGGPGAQQKLALFTEYTLPSLVERLLDGDHTLLETAFLERLLMLSLHENDARKGTSKAATTAFWQMIYQMKPSFFIEQDEDCSRFRMERFVEASGNEEALAALAQICADFYAEQRRRIKNEELGQCFTVKHQGRAEPALCHFVWTYPERAQRIIDAFTSSKGWKKECLEVWKFLLMQKDLHGTPPLLLAYGHRRNEDGQHVDLFSSLLQTLSPQEWSLLPVTAEQGKEVSEDSSSNDKREETLARGQYGEETYLAYAIERQDAELLKALLESNFDPNVKIAGQKNANEETGLRHLLYTLNLLHEGHKNANEETVLHRAIWMRWAEGTQLLLQHNAKNAPRKNGTTPSDLLRYCLQKKPEKWRKWDSLHPEERPLWERIGRELNGPSTP